VPHERTLHVPPKKKEKFKIRQLDVFTTLIIVVGPHCFAVHELVIWPENCLDLGISWYSYIIIHPQRYIPTAAADRES
jgi:hypothetical protein